MIPSRSRAFLLGAPLALSTFLSPFSYAWGPEGHEIVARIAERRLTPGAAQQIGGLLASDSTNHHRVHLWYSGVCNWADFVRKDRTNSAPWHFVDIPYRATQYDPVRDCQNHSGCAVEAIATFSKAMTDPSKTTSARVEALKFVVHVVADVHQPLHCAERNGDQGGNLCLVKFPGQVDPVKLHYVWDRLLIKRSLDDRHLETIEYADHLDRAISGTEALEWGRGTPDEWAMESHRIATRDAYASVPMQEPPFALPESYLAHNQAVVDTQLEKAGVRLAMLLNDAFK